MSVKKKARNIGAAAAALLLVVMMVTQLFTPAVVLAATSDSKTHHGYQDIFRKSSTENSGRVWSDKTVISEQNTYVEGAQIQLDEGEDFNVIYSAIGSSEKITGKGDVALDVVFVLDTSGSMNNKTSDGKLRITAAMDALNASMKTLLENSPYNRIGVATFASGADELLKLDRYDSTQGKYPVISKKRHSDTIKVKCYKDGKEQEFSTPYKGGTNTQAGIQRGMDMLLNVQDTTVEINGKQVKRIPILVMLSDGASTYSLKDAQWWNPGSTGRQGPGNEAYYGNGMKAMMTAAYKKQEVSEHYGVTGTPMDTRIYTIGLGVGELEGKEKSLAQITLNPSAHWDDNDKAINNKIRSAWETYSKGEDVDVDVESGETYSLKHPEKGDISSLKYENGYYEPSNASELNEVFKGIVNEITTSVPDYPTDIKSAANPAEGGYITYTDPLGEYMQVKKIKFIQHNQEQYQVTEPVIEGNKAVYRGVGTVKDSITKQDVDLSNVIITVTTNTDGSQVLEAKIPAPLIPLKVNEVKLTKEGAVESNRLVQDDTPIRIVYSVGLTDQARTLDGVSQEYIDANTENGKVNFYSNLYTGKTNEQGQTIGDAYTQFTPALDNPNYYFQQDVVIYHDRELTNPVTTAESFDDGTTYYLGTPYYEANTVQTALVERTGDAFNFAAGAGRLIDKDGNWALKAGTPRTYHIGLDLGKQKDVNSTGTADMLYAPSTEVAGNTITAMYFNHGNNGKVQMDAPKDLVLKKTVRSQEGVTAPDKTYQFNVTIPSRENKTITGKLVTGTKEEDYKIIFDANGTAIVELKDGQSLIIPRIAGSYTVEEVNPGKGFTVIAPENAKGTVGLEQNETVEFINEYKIEPITIDQTEYGFPMTKILKGKKFEETDQYSFKITGAEGTLPENTIAVIDGKNVKDAASAQVDFGKFTFTKPGVFEYIVEEVYGSEHDVPGISYDTSKYKLIIEIVDNGDGTISPGEHRLQKTADNGSWVDLSDDKITFINTFNAKSADVILKGKKVLENQALNEYMDGFRFKIQKAEEDETQPMPEGLPENGIISSDVNTGAIELGKISFTTEQVGKTYKYVVTEVQPTEDGTYEGKPVNGAVKDETTQQWKYKGIVFDNSKKEISIEVTKQNVGKDAIVVPVVKGNDFEFVNTYYAEKDYNFTDVGDNKTAIKNITGRKFKKGDIFTFDITSECSDGTKPLSKDVILPESVTIRPAEGGQQAEFDIGNLHFDNDDIGKTYTYTITEREGNLGGITYDTTPRKVTLTIYDNHDGTLRVERTGDSLEWTNSYRAKWIYSEGYVRTVEKILDGKEVEEGSFTVSVTALNGAPMDSRANGGNTILVNNGTEEYYSNHERQFAVLDDLVFTMEDMEGAASKTFEYEIREVKPEPPVPGMIYDDSVYRLAVPVIDNQEGGLTVDYDRIGQYKMNKIGEFEPVDRIEFHNKYQPDPVEVTPFENNGEFMLQKQLIGPRNENLKADEFKYSFELKSGSTEGGVEILNNGPVGNMAAEETAEDKNIGNISFAGSKLIFKKAGTYVFTIKEDTVTSEGVKNLTPEIEITYQVEDVGGRYEVTPSYTGTVTDGIFVNEYETEGTLDKDPSGRSYLQVEKILSEREWNEKDKFTFTLTANNSATETAVKNGYVTPSSDKIVIDDSTPEHKATFGTITFTQPGDYEFRVSESVEGLLPGVHPDGVSRIVKVTATDKGNGTMDITCSITAETDPEQTGAKNNLVFTNVYKPGETTLPGTGNLNVKKVLQGRPWIESDAFVFTLSGGDELTKNAIGTDIILTGNADTENITITSKSVDQTEHFGNITFKKDGHYVFDITENAPEANNVSYEAEPKKIYVNVTLNADGSLTAAVDTVNSAKLEFTNTYTPAPAELSGETDLVVTKDITGREWHEGESFQFQIQPFNDMAQNTECVTMPEQTVITVNGSDKTGHFDNITFKKAGKYVFAVTEKIPEGVLNGANGLTYDTAEKKITVYVTDNYDGTLTVTKDSELSQELAFTNRYKPSPLSYDGSTNLKVQKVLNGRDWKEEDVFTFTLTHNTLDAATDTAYRAGDFVLPQNANRIQISGQDKDHTAGFGDIIFKKAGVYQFNIQENRGFIGGISYDETVKTFTVTVTDDGNGNLTATENPLTVFTNTYTPAPVVFPAEGTGNLQVTKVFTGRNWKENDSFSFTISPIYQYEEGSFEMGTQECTITGNQLNKVASFGDITFYKPSTEDGYQFVIKEVIPESAIKTSEGKFRDLSTGVIYDGSEKRISILVTDDKNGKLNASIIPGKTDARIFYNSYVPQPLVIIPTSDPVVDEGTIGIQLNKILTGRDWKDTDEFTFRIEGLDGAPMPQHETATIKHENEVFDFGTLTIKAEDMDGAETKIFRYKVTEVIPDTKIPGVQYCETPVIFRVKVSDNGKGFLEAGDRTPDSGLILNELDGSRKGNFINNYVPSETTLNGSENLKVVKNFTGRDQDQWLEGDQFTFQLFVTDSATNKAIQDGKVILPENANGITIKAADDPKENAFGDITFKAPGEYQFKVSEINQNIPGVTYAPEQTVVVDVTDNQNGQLVATVREGTALVPFVNTYEAGSVTLSGNDYLNVVKEINGREWKDGDNFTFSLSAGDEVTETAIADAMIQMPDAGEMSITIDNNTVGHSKHFGNIIFKNAGKYKFQIEEKIPEEASEAENGLFVLDGIYYDPTPHMIDVKVEDAGEGQLKITTAPENITFVNEYKHGPATLKGADNLNVLKILNGRYLTYGEQFEFYMTAENELAQTVKLPGNVIVDVMQNDSEVNQNLPEGQYAYSNNFDDMTFEEPGVYEFNVWEVIPDAADKAPGMIYDEVPEKITVTVVDNKDGTMSAAADKQTVTFTNAYKAKPLRVSCKDNIKIEKNLFNRNAWLETDVFEFRMVPTAETSALNTSTKTAFEMPKDADSMKITRETPNHTGYFGDFIFYEDGVYEFDIFEVAGKDKHIRYDDATYHVTINVYDYPSLGELSANVNLTSDEWDGLDDTIFFSNSYEPEPATLEGATNFRIEKSIAGREWMEGDEFTFKLKRNDRNYFGETTIDGPTEVTIAYNKEGNYTANFGDITFNGTGEYIFEVTEVVPENKIPGIEYGGTAKFVIEVTDDNKGQLHAKVVSPSTLKFTNIYTAVPGILSGEENLRVQKVLEGRNQWLDTDQFTFELSGRTQATQQAIKDGIVVINNDKITINKDTPEFTSNFGDITFNAPGSYVFEVREVIPDDASPQITYDTSKKTIFVEVVDNKKGQLVATLSDTDVTSVFTNTYSPKPVVLSGEENLTVTKEIAGRDWMKGDTFLFNMAGENEAAKQGIADGSIILPNNFDEISITDTTKPEKTANFGDITFKMAGTYTFRISEKAGTINGISYDPVDRLVTVIVKENPNGKLSIAKVNVIADLSYTERDKDNLTFTNTYKPEAAVLDGATYLNVEKVLEGRDWKTNDSFSFRLQADMSDEETANAVNDSLITLPSDASELTLTKDHKADAFGDIRFQKEGNYQFVISEIIPEGAVANGITYAENQIVKVHVEDLHNGTMTADSDQTTYRFVNTYNPEYAQIDGSTDLMIEKVFAGKEWNGEAFTFTLTPVGATAGNENVVNGSQQITVTSEDIKENGITGQGLDTESAAQKAFGNITFKAKGNYVFEISEVKGDNANINYAANKVTISVQVTDDGNGKLAAAVEHRSGDLVFKNTYKPEAVIIGEDGEDQIQIQKNLLGRELTDNDKWSFTISRAEDTAADTPLPEKTVIQNTGSQAVFGNMTFTTPGVYKYVVTESGHVPGITNDEGSVTVTITVTHNERENKLTADLSYSKDGDVSGGMQAFVNKYKAAPAELAGDTYLKVNKVLNGRPNDSWTEADQYTFTLTMDPEHEETQAKAGTIILPENAGGITVNADNKSAAFGNITFTEEGDYQFLITEIDTQTAGVTYDPDAVRTVSVNVKDNHDGTMTVTAAKDTAYEFVNTYTTEDAVLDGSANLNVEKTFTGKNWTDEEFTFNLAPTGETADSQYVVNGEQTITITAADLVENGTAKKAFGDITFKKAGDYTFKITETAGDNENIIYADNVAEITVHVEDNNAGSLVAETDSTTGIYAFENTYTTEAVKAQISAKKFLEGRTLTESDKWTFTLAPAMGQETNPMPAEASVQNDMEQIAFGNITFTAPGTYNYVITEGNESYGNIANDTGYIEVAVQVTYDADKGQLTADTQYRKNGDSSKGDDAFVNQYNLTPGVLSGETYLNVEKIFTGREWKAGDQFAFSLNADPEDEFTVQAVENGRLVLPADITIHSESAQADGNKTNHFGDMTFRQPGTYKFVVVENNTALAGVTYDTSVQKITVEVKEDTTKGILNVTADPAKVSFTNTYQAKEITLDGSEAFAFDKKFVGREWTDNDQFTFTLTSQDENAPMPENNQVVVSKPAKGNQAAFDFGSITFTTEDMAGAQYINGVKAKTFTYNVVENVPDNTNGIKYDNGVRTVTITVIDDGKGELSLQGGVTIEGEEVFTNEYSSEITYGEAAGEAGLKITKNLENHELADQQFGFRIEANDERSKAKLNSIGGTDGVMEVRNGQASLVGTTAQWSVRPFDEMKFVKDENQDDTGAYSFTISELQDSSKAGYTYDETSYNVNITVTDGQNGVLTVATDQPAVVFNNRYDAAGKLGGEGNVKINATKTLNGRQINPDEFQFEVVNLKNEKVVAHGRNTAAAAGQPENAVTVEFDPISYSLDTIEESGYTQRVFVNGNAVYYYSYFVKEVEPAAQKVTPKVDSFTINVKICDDGLGNLVPEVVYPEGMGRLDFVNEYESKTGTADITASKLLNAEGSDITLEDIAGKFQFVLEGIKADYKPLEIITEVPVENEGAAEPEVLQNEPEADEESQNDSDQVGEASENEIGEELFADELFMNIQQPDAPKQISQPTAPVQETTITTTTVDKQMPIPMPATSVAVNDAAGNISFGAINYDLSLFEGVQPEADGSRVITFTYSIQEVNNVPGITNDPNSKQLFTVKVVENGIGEITVEKTGDVKFVNEYHFVPATSSPTEPDALSIKKKLEGRSLVDAEFKFEMKDADGNVAATGKNDAEGIVNMSSVTFEKPGVYEYTLNEVNGGKKLKNGVTYDESVYKVQALVTDRKDGTLSVEWSVTDGENKMVFTNHYDPKATAVTLGAVKILSGREIKEAEFSFQLKDENGKVLQTIKNDKEGRIRFEKIRFDEAGTWNYTIEEVQGNEDKMKYDDTVYHLTIKVTDDERGFLRPEIVKEDETPVVFHNIYEKEPEPCKPDTKPGSNTKPDAAKPERPAPANPRPDSSAAPSTGDTENRGHWFMLMVLSALGIAGAFGKSKKKTEE